MGVDVFVFLEEVLPYIRMLLAVLQIHNILDITLPVATAGALPMQTLVEVVFAVGLSVMPLSLPNILGGFLALAVLRAHVMKQKRSAWFVDKLVFMHMLQAAAWAVRLLDSQPYARYYK